MIAHDLNIAALRDGYRHGSFTPEDVAQRVLARIEAYRDPAVWIARVPAADLLGRARRLTRDIASIERLPLYGIPFAVKDNIDAAGLPTTAACPAFAYEPAHSAFVVSRLLEAGALLVGKTNLDQFATGLVGTRSPYGAPRCFFDAAYISGGSSSGSAVAVAAGLCSFSLGTDTAGSGRVPASFNAIVGLKPSKGLLSTSGVVPACRSLDCVAIFARTVREVRTVARVATEFDPADVYARHATSVALSIERFRFGVLRATDREFCGDAAAAALYDAAIARLERCGGEAVEFDYAPFRETAALLYGGPWVAERMAAIAGFYREHAAEMDPTVRSVIGAADRYSALDTFTGMYALRALERRAAAEWQNIDVMLLPTAPTIFRVDDVAADPIGRNSLLGTYTNFVNLLDYSAIAIPAGFRAASGLPFGVTLVAPALADRDLTLLAERFESAGEQRVELAVAGAHLSGLPLNGQLLELGATLVRAGKTAPFYRLYALPGTAPPKPGLVRDPDFAGAGVEIELWSLSATAFGSFVAAVPAPMAIGKIVLDDGTAVSGFLCEPLALTGARDITAYGGWRSFVTQQM